MPNWITNNLEVKHEDPKQIAWLSKCFKKGTIDFEKITPPPAKMFRGDLGEKERKYCKKKGIPTWYDWQSENWGCKWNARDGGIVKKTKYMIVFTFLTPWSPPEPILEKLKKMGFEVRGIWKDEGDDTIHCFGEYGNWSANVEFEYCG